MPVKSRIPKLTSLTCLFATLGLFVVAAVPVKAEEPIKIGFGMALTGPLAANGKMALLAMQIWEEDVNAKGGLLGRPVKLVYYDDQSNPATFRRSTPSSSTSTRSISSSAAMRPRSRPPCRSSIGRKKLFIGLFGLRHQQQFKYPKIFRDDPERARLRSRPSPAASSMSPRRRTRSRRRSRIVDADAEFSPERLRRRPRECQEASGFKIVYDKTYPPSTIDFTPIVRAIQATNPDLLVICSYPLDSVGMIRRSTRSVSSRRCWAARWSACRRPHSRPSSAAAQRHRQLRFLAAGAKRWSSPASRSC